jgi:probable rRNA maturation factor
LQLKAQAVLNVLDCPDGELSIVITDDPQIEELNRKYLHRNKPTNVIAFPMQEGHFSDLTPSLLGDVVISVETTQKEASSADIEFEDRFDQLLVHGILHLFGYDHEHDDHKALVMEEKSTAILKLIADIQPLK